MDLDAIVVCKWDEAANGLLDERVVRSLHMPRNMHRVSRARYPQGAHFRTTTKAGIVYVLNGYCEYLRDGVHVELRRGEFAHVPAGTYDVRVLGDDELVLIRAWRLPFVVPPSVS